MARSINKVTLLGNLGKDPELRYMPNGIAVCNIRLATNETHRDAQGNVQKHTEWHNLVAFGRLAEICAQYLNKGSKVYVEGSLQTRSWQDQDGITRYATKIKIRDLVILDSRNQEEDHLDEPPVNGRVDRPAVPIQGNATKASGGLKLVASTRNSANRASRPAVKTQNKASVVDSPDESYPLIPDDDLPF